MSVRTLAFKKAIQNHIRKQKPFEKPISKWRSAPALASRAYEKQVQRRTEERLQNLRRLRASNTSSILFKKKEVIKEDEVTKASKLLPLNLRRQLNQIAFPNIIPLSSNIISIHGGYKIQIGLIIHRIPLHFKEPEWKKDFRQYRDRWRIITDNHLSLHPSLIFMKIPRHQYISEDKVLKLEEAGLTEKALQVGIELLPELERLLLNDGIQRGTQIQEHGHKDRSKRLRQRKEKRLLDPDTSNIYRAPWDLLTLLVWYPTVEDQEGKGCWSLPLIDRIHGATAKETLRGLCDSQFGNRFTPYIPNLCPISEHKYRFDPQSVADYGLRGRQVFYYRGYWVPDTQLELRESGLARRHAWVRSREVSNYLPETEMAMLRSCTILN